MFAIVLIIAYLIAFLPYILCDKIVNQGRLGVAYKVFIEKASIVFVVWLSFWFVSEIAKLFLDIIAVL